VVYNLIRGRVGVQEHYKGKGSLGLQIEGQAK